MLRISVRTLLQLLPAIYIILFSACSGEEDDILSVPTPDQDTTNTEDTVTHELSDSKKVNTFVCDMLDNYYLWNKEITLPDSIPDSDPQTLFYSLLPEKDQFSYLEEDTENTTTRSSSEKELTYSFGYSITYGQFYNTNQLFAFVNFVYKDSPAEKAGIKRGDIFIKINGSSITTDNYTDLLYASSLTIELGTYNKESNSISIQNKTVSLTAESLYLDPIIHSAVIDKANTRIGYLMYSDYTGDANNDLDNVFSDFKQQGVTEVILDLRYNLGGTDEALIHMASLLTPSNVVRSSSLLLQNVWNDEYMDYMTGHEELLNDYFDPTVSVNMDLDHLYILTGTYTASASEATIIGLMPYMNVITLGATTYGKCYGGPIISPSFYKETWSDLDNWELYLIAFKFANANGYTDFTDGLEPTVYIAEDIETAEVGSEDDYLLNATLSYITTGQTNTAATTKSCLSGYTIRKKLITNKDIRKRNLVKTIPGCM